MFNLFKNLLGGTADTAQLQQSIQQGALLVDVRTPGEFASGHPKGAINIPLEQIPSQIAKLKGKKGIVVFCRSGNRSGQAKTILEQAGITNVINGGPWKNVARLIP